VIQLTVSSEQSSVQVPNVVGITPAQAGGSLRGANLAVGTQTNQCTSQFASGLVSGQSPAAGTQQPPSTAVNLTISTGPCVSVPAVIGDTQQQAATAIDDAGLTPSFTQDTGCANGTATLGNVDAQDPAANAQVSSGSTVNMTVCNSPTSGTTTTTGSSTTTSSTTTTTSGGLLGG
jgi:serine/threonine-protein kinase